MTDPDLKPGEVYTVKVRIRDRVSTGWLCSLLDRMGEVQSQQVIPASCLIVEENKAGGVE